MEALRNSPQLQQFVLTEVTPTGKELGTGSYGSVIEVNYRQVICAGKKLHETLLDIGNEGVSRMVQKYLQECQLMSSLRHPNITQFLGLCFLPGTQLPLLVMERLEASLDDLLEHMPNLPLSLKRSVLEDVASGLLYLHKMQPPVIHRDLTSKNVLLTSSLVAKITDMGNSRIVDLRPGRMARTLTEFPGTLVYMPPEALNDRHQYGPSLDVFSFGHLALYTLTQVFPGDLLPSTYYSPNNLASIQARTELERREVYIEKLETRCGATIALVELVKQCLQNIPEHRPSTEELLIRLQGMRVEVEGEYGGPIKLDLVRVKLAKEIRKKEIRLQEQQELHEAEVQAINVDLEEKKQHNNELSAQIQQQQDELVLKDRQLQQLQDELTAERHEVQQVLKEFAAKNELIQQLNDALQDLHVEVSTLKEEKEILMKQQSKTSLQITWRRGPDMPFEMSGFIQSVVQDKKVYVGGGASPHEENIVMEYDVKTREWAILPPYKAIWFAMVIVSNQLVLVGGKSYPGSGHSNELGAWTTDGKEWTHPYPSMPTARCRCSVVPYNQWLVVAGGWAQNHEVSCVEVLNIDDKQWHVGCPMPRTWCNMKTASADHVAYFGGAGTNVYSVSLPDLIADLRAVHSTSMSERQSNIWKELPREPVRDSTPLSIRGLLFLVGGVEHSWKMATTAIHHFDPLTRKWVKVGDWPSARSKCACVMIEDGELFVAGGWEIKTRSKRMDSARLEITCFS